MDGLVKVEEITALGAKAQLADAKNAIATTTAEKKADDLNVMLVPLENEEKSAADAVLGSKLRL